MPTVGLIGLGAIAHKHLVTVSAMDGFEAVGGCDTDPAHRARWHAETGTPAFDDHRDLLATGPDVVVVALPHALHAPVTLDALDAGCHVIVEKPMAVSVNDCRRMLDRARARARALVVAEGACFEPGVVETGRRFARGELGRFLTGSIVHARRYFHAERPAWFLDPAASGGGMFANVGVHRLATARGCLPGLRPAMVSAAVARVPEHAVEACTTALVRYHEGGAMLYEEVGYFDRPSFAAGGIRFVFEAGIVAWDAQTWRLMGRDGHEVTCPLPTADETYTPVYDNLCRAMDGREIAPATWEFAVDATITQAAYASARTGEMIDLTSEAWRVRDGESE